MRITRFAGYAGVALVGTVLGVLLLGRVSADIGPLRTTMSAVIEADGGATVELRPLGSLRIDTHVGPLGLRVALDQVDADAAQAFVARPTADVENEIGDDVRDGVARLAVRVLTAVVVTTAALGLIVFRRRRPAGIAAAIAAGLVLVTAGGAWATFRPRAISEPEFDGLVAAAPNLIGDVEDVVVRFEQYRAQLRRMVGNVSELYRTLETLPTFTSGGGTTRVLHVSDLHLNPTAFDLISSVIRRFDIDLVIDTGDLTDWGSEPEAAFVARIAQLRVPYVYVRGNHDSRATQAAVARQPNAVVLDGQIREVAGLRIAGFGDPRFTPDKSADDDAETRRAVIETAQEGVVTRLMREVDGPPDVVAVHDPAIAELAIGDVPVVLAGHRHKHRFRTVDGTHVLIGGSTGGAGLRGLEHDEPTPLSMSVLLFDRASGELRAVDHLTIGGLGAASVRIDRVVVKPPDSGTDDGSQDGEPTDDPDAN